MQLERNIIFFECVASKAYSAFEKNDYSAALAWIRIAGFCTWWNHAGFYADSKHENMLHIIGNNFNYIKASSMPELPSRARIRESGLIWLRNIADTKIGREVAQLFP
ncbi:MAG: hypothetical protein ACLQDF_05980 [Desulfomonilia bacterium]